LEYDRRDRTRDAARRTEVRLLQARVAVRRYRTRDMATPAAGRRNRAGRMDRRVRTRDAARQTEVT